MAKDKEPRRSDYLRFSSLGFQMAITIGLGAWAGTYLDNKFQTEKPYYSIGIILIAIAIALYQVINEVMQMSKDDDDSDNNNTEKNQPK